MPRVQRSTALLVLDLLAIAACAALALPALT
jgi:hypothetical protein